MTSSIALCQGPELVAELGEFRVKVAPNSNEQFAALLKSEGARYGKIAAAANNVRYENRQVIQ
ncbi:MAG: hypothetical protein ACM338_07265 [Betaproteobacteria bacterium]